MYMIKRYLFILLLLSAPFLALAQWPLLGGNMGSATADAAKAIKIAPNGNIYVAGKFTGTMDIDPSSATYNLTSNGNDDIFVACYSRTGALNWGFNIGGSLYDAALSLAVDTASNVYVGGYFQTAGVDFDPSSSASILGFAGGTTLPYYGDGFLAKYSPSGTYQWAKALGDATVNDAVLGTSVDIAGNVYATGIFSGSMTVSGSIMLNSASGKGYMVKYTSAGTAVWAHNFGSTSLSCTPHCIQAAGRYLYVGGSFEGTANFNPWGTASTLAATGADDAFLARYDTLGNFSYVKHLRGDGAGDEILGLDIDAQKSIYVIGATSSANLTFNVASSGTSTLSAPGGGANKDAFLARYDSAGTYQWAHLLGGNGSDVGNSIVVNRPYVYVGGSFNSTIDFDPSAATDMHSSLGGSDVWMSKFDILGNYICGFSAGGVTANDAAWSLTLADSNRIAVAGEFGGSSTDFNSSTTDSFLLSATGSEDAFFIKYNWAQDSLLVGSWQGDTLCAGDTAMLTLHITNAYTGTYTVNYTDGTSIFTATSVRNNVPFIVTPAPVVTTTYSIISITAASVACSFPSPVALGTARIVVHSLPHALHDSVVACNTIRFAAQASDTSYHWSFGDGNTARTNPVTHTYTTVGVFRTTLTAIDSFGCPYTDTVSYAIDTPHRVNIGPDTFLCASSYTLTSLYTYPSSAIKRWSTGVSSSSITVGTTNYYWFTVTIGNCTIGDTARVRIIYQPVSLLGNDTNICNNTSINLSVSAASTCNYVWSNGANVNNITVSAPGTYWVHANDSGCIVYDTINITTRKAPTVHLGPDVEQCSGIPIFLAASDTFLAPSYLWSTGATTNILTVNTTGTYVLTVTDNGCSASDTINVLVKPSPILSLGNDTVLCKGTSFVRAIAQPTGTVYNWSTGSTAPSITIDTPGIYALTVTYLGCSATDTISIKQLLPPQVQLGSPDTTLCNGYQMLMVVNGDQSNYLWQDGTTNPYLNIVRQGIYWARVTNVCGTAIDTLVVFYTHCDLFIPNAFTPNGDGKNDVFHIVGITAPYSNYKMSVFNRWGQRIYYNEDITQGWDGTFNGEPQEIGTYFYYISYSFEGSTSKLTGEVQLIR